jgi:hypothetical protein
MPAFLWIRKFIFGKIIELSLVILASALKKVVPYYMLVLRVAANNIPL